MTTIKVHEFRATDVKLGQTVLVLGSLSQTHPAVHSLHQDLVDVDRWFVIGQTPSPYLKPSPKHMRREVTELDEIMDTQLSQVTPKNAGLLLHLSRECIPTQKSLTRLLRDARHMRLTVLMTSQNPMALTPCHRAQLGWVFTFLFPEENTMRQVYTRYMDLAKTYTHFRHIVDAICTPLTILGMCNTLGGSYLWYKVHSLSTKIVVRKLERDATKPRPDTE